LPEAPEIRIMSEFLNQELGLCDVVRVEKSPISKNKCDLTPLEGKKWRIRAFARGKEMMIKFHSEEEVLSMKIGFARIGSIEKVPIRKIDQSSFDKNAMLRLYTESNVYYVSDFTRYVIWRWSGDWDTRRSPDILTDHNEWRANLYRNRKSKKFDVPIFEIMTNQEFFNGIGTFTRSEILCRTRFSPFTNFKEVLSSDLMREDFFAVCKETMEDVVRLGGLQFKFWKNPFNASKRSFNKWVRSYNKMGKAFFLKDSQGRKFWFEKQWIPDYIDWVKENEVQDTRLLEKIYRKTKRKSSWQ
jgi:endonuclease VIII-like 1